MAEIIGIPVTSYYKYENGSNNLNNIKLIDKIANTLKIKDLKKFPEYYKFLKTNPNQRMRQYIEKNRLSIRMFAKIIKIEYKVVYDWVKYDTTISETNYNKLKNKYKKLFKEKEKGELEL